MTTNFNRIDPTPPVRSSWLVPAALTCAAAAVVGLSGFVFSSEALSISALPVALKDTVVTPLLALDLQQAVPAICTAAGAYLHSLWTTPAPLDGMNHDFQKTESNPTKWDSETALAAVQQNGLAFKKIPKELITDEITLAAIQRDWWMIEYIPQDLLTEKIALAAVKGNGFALKFVPAKLITPKFALAAVQQNPRAIEYLSQELINNEIALAAVEGNGFLLKYVPKELITEEIALAAVQKIWHAIGYIPEEVLTEKIAFAAVQKNWQAIHCIPEEVLTEEIALAAVQQDYKALLRLPEQVITDAVIDLALGERSDIPSFVQQQSLAQQLGQPPIIANPQSIAPTTGPLPAALQSFLDQHLLTDKELTSDLLEFQGFEKLAQATLKEVWIHPSLPGHVFKISHDRGFSKHHSSYALIQDALTMRHLQTLVDEHNLSHVHIPETYLVMNGNQGVIIQERVQIEKSAPETEGWSELETLIQLMDQKFYPLISDVVKEQPKAKIVEIVEKLVEIAYQRPLSPKFQQFIERAWVWDLAPEFAHNAGSAKEFPEDIFIIDGGL